VTDLPTIRVTGPPNDGLTPIYYGIRSGLFQKAGLNVELTPANSGVVAAAAVIGGSADVAYINMLSLSQSHLRGVPLEIVAAGSLYLSNKPNAGMAVLKDSPIRTAKDLDGKTLASGSVKDLNAAGMLAWIDQNGGDSHTVKVIELPTSAAMLAALEERRIDAAAVIEPGLAQMLKAGDTRVLAHHYDALAKRFEQTAFVSMPAFVDSNRALMQRFAAALRQSVIYVNAHPAQTVDILSSYTGATPEEVAQSVRIITAETVDVRDLQPLIDVAAKYGLIDHSFPASELISPTALKSGR
jgi:NitT/TauT family transport system substrate-binding protein